MMCKDIHEEVRSHLLLETLATGLESYAISKNKKYQEGKVFIKSKDIFYEIDYRINSNKGDIYWRRSNNRFPYERHYVDDVKEFKFDLSFCFKD